MCDRIDNGGVTFIECPAAVMIVGESDSGKGVAAHMLHAEGGRASGPFIAVNCGVIPGSLVRRSITNSPIVIGGRHWSRRPETPSAGRATMNWRWRYNCFSWSGESLETTWLLLFLLVLVVCAACP